VVFVGGPVSSSSVIGLAQVAGEVPAGSWEPVAGTIGVVDLTTDPLLLTPAITALRCFAGYSGWGAGQLEGELAEEAWIVEPPMPAELFPDDPETLWQHVLARKGGQFALIARMPDDPSVN
jgi:putative transcriptional regulator